MSITRKRAGRKSWETRQAFNNTVGNFAQAMAEKIWKYDSPVTKAMIIERTAKETGKAEVITFSQAYAELSGWLGKSFVNTSEEGFSDMLAETFFQNAQIHTPKGVYRLWVKPEPKPVETLMINLNDRQAEFKEASSRAADSDLEVFADFERDVHIVVNRRNNHEYKINLKPVDGKVLVSCECGDFIHRNRICKHISAFLQDCLCSILAKFSSPAPKAPAFIPKSVPCACVYNWDDKYTDYCPAHAAEARELERMAT